MEFVIQNEKYKRRGTNISNLGWVEKGDGKTFKVSLSYR